MASQKVQMDGFYEPFVFQSYSGAYRLSIYIYRYSWTGGPIHDGGDSPLRIPTRPQVRSLNLSNAVAVAAYETLRQWTEKA